MAEKGIECVLEYEKRHGREPTDVSRDRRFVGYDIISIDNKRGDHRTIEVKSTTSGGIPDAFENEFTRGLKFVATHLYLVWFEKDKRTVKCLQVITKKYIDDFSDEHKVVRSIKFAAGLQSMVKRREFLAD